MQKFRIIFIALTAMVVFILIFLVFTINIFLVPIAHQNISKLAKGNFYWNGCNVDDFSQTLFSYKHIITLSFSLDYADSKDSFYWHLHPWNTVDKWIDQDEYIPFSSLILGLFLLTPIW